MWIRTQRAAVDWYIQKEEVNTLWKKVLSYWNVANDTREEDEDVEDSDGDEEWSLQLPRSQHCHSTPLIYTRLNVKEAFAVPTKPPPFFHWWKGSDDFFL